MDERQPHRVAETLGERIALLREERGWTQKQLAERAGVSVAFLSEIENDKRNPSTEVLLRISEALGASLDYLVTGRTDVAPMRRPLYIPAELAAAAERNGWSVGHAADLLRARGIVLERRSRGGARPRKDWTAEEWEDFEQRLFGDDSS